MLKYFWLFSFSLAGHDFIKSVDDESGEEQGWAKIACKVTF